MLLRTNGIGQKTRWFIFYRNICLANHNCSYISPNSMIDNIIVILLEGDGVNWANVHHTLVISHNLGCSINRNSENSKPVAHFHGQFCGNSHEHQLWYMVWGFRGILPPAIPINWSFVEKHEYYSIITLSFKIMCMIYIRWSSHAPPLDLAYQVESLLHHQGIDLTNCTLDQSLLDIWGIWYHRWSGVSYGSWGNQIF